MPATPTVPLPSGAELPLLGFGTWQLRGSTAEEATATALAAGYRHLDTATMYGNEREVGAALRAWRAGPTPDGVFVTTKLPPDRSGAPRAILEQSLSQLGVDAIDLWLIHWPGGDDVATWREFVAARDAGLVRDIGVSNFSADELDAVTRATGVAPAVNQIRWSPLLYDASVVAAHADRGIVLEGYSGLKGGTLTHPTVTGIAARLGLTAAQVIVRWHVQHGFVVIPKSANAERITSNAQLGVELPAGDMAALDALGR